jgi:GNAT superfamily N-acetyltransferase
MSPVLELSDTIDPALADVVGEGLNDFNDAVAPNDRKPLAVIVRDPATGNILGGITGRTSLGLLFLDLVYLPEHLRGGGLGGRMLRMAEDEGAKRGCVAAVLYTISFQAPGFYERHGWRRFGEVACLPPGTSRIFMTKTLAPMGAAPPRVAGGR